MNVQTKHVPRPEPTLFETSWAQHERPRRIGKTARATDGLRLKDASVKIVRMSFAHAPENLPKYTSKNVARHAASEKDWALRLELKTKSPESKRWYRTILAPRRGIYH